MTKTTRFLTLTLVTLTALASACTAETSDAELPALEAFYDLSGGLVLTEATTEALAEVIENGTELFADVENTQVTLSDVVLNEVAGDEAFTLFADGQALGTLYLVGTVDSANGSTYCFPWVHLGCCGGGPAYKRRKCVNIHHTWFQWTCNGPC